ncbi:MAG: tetratricopeptide repeat protein [Anaerolineales bacterium]|nr:tetratricopeptide repeat protein [Anaerolineales bacterium]
MQTLHIKLLGNINFGISGRPLDLVSQKARGLLIYLAVEPPHIHSREKLSALLWPEQPPGKAAHNLRQALTALRKAVGDLESRELLLDISRESIGITPHAQLEIDVDTFLGNVNSVFLAGTRTESRIDIRRLKKAGDMYRGPFLHDFDLKDSEPFEEWALLQRESIHRQAIRVYENLLGYYQRRGQNTQMLQTAETLLELAPWDEQTRRLLMILYAQSGQKRTALSVYHSGKKYLKESLDLDPSTETVQLFEKLRGNDLEDLPVEDLPPAATNLMPESTPFIGREKQLDDLSSLLSRDGVRLVTILGPGGVGKTRLADQLAREQVGQYQDGVYFIPLDAIETPERILPLIAQHLEIQPLKNQSLDERIFQVLEKKDILLVLDNFEHLRQATGLISQLLGRTRKLQFVITSRQQLNIKEEWTYAPGSLSLPLASATADEIASSEAVDLFLQSCTRLGKPVSRKKADLFTISGICELVEGFPLGIELAAAATRSRSLDTIHQQIKTNLGSLSSAISNLPSRHRSLRATFEHSWQLLNDSSRQALRRLAIFHGSFDPELAVTLTEASQQDMDLLLTSSLLVHDGIRFAFHPLVRQFAQEKLEQDPTEQEKLQEKFTLTFSTILKESCAALRSPDRVEELSRLQKDEENLTAAWNWSLHKADQQLINQSMQGMFLYYYLQSRHFEGFNAFSIPETFPIECNYNKTRGWLHLYQGGFAQSLGQYDKAVESFSAAEDLLRKEGTPFDLAVCSVRQAGVAINLGQHDRVLSLCSAALPVFQQQDDPWWLALTTFLVGDAMYRKGKIDEARTALEESISHARTSRDPARITAGLNSLADVLCYEGDLVNAEQTFRECLQISRFMQDYYGAAVHLNNLGTVFHMQEKWEDAAFAYRESYNLCVKYGDRYGEAIALSNLGEIAMEKGEFDKARSCFLQGLSISEEIANTWSMLASLGNLAEISIRLKDFSPARGFLTRALQTALDTDTFTVLPKLLLLTARTDLENNHKNRAASLLSQILYTEDVEEQIRSHAASLVEQHSITLPSSFSRDLKSSANSILQSLVKENDDQ